MRLIFLAIFMCAVPVTGLTKPLFPNSVASNDLEFIMPNDPGACWQVVEAGGGRTEMYDPRRDRLFVDGAFHFDASYAGQTLRINVHPGVVDPLKRAMEAAASVSRLPVQMRSSLRYVNILDGDGTAWSEDLGGFFTLYDDLMSRRLAEHDLDETVFHETAHVAFDRVLSGDPDWRASQIADGDFITGYASDNPRREDIAESALFAWTMTFHPGRLPSGIEDAVRQIMPNRLEYLSNILDGYVPPSC